eukprot:3254925-Pyramimonas_sp.AAC.1
MDQLISFAQPCDLQKKTTSSRKHGPKNTIVFVGGRSHGWGFEATMLPRDKIECHGRAYFKRVAPVVVVLSTYAIDRSHDR